jgi:hypothetical protein
MTYIDVGPDELVDVGPADPGDACVEVLAPRDVPLGGPRAMTVRRTLPHKDRRMVGAWCFVDHYGPDDVAAGPGMQVPPHPHTGLQTVSWLFEGEVLHRDSLGSTQLVRPGELNLMTAGGGISHSEESPAEHSPVLHGLQLWTALPDHARHREPAFDHHADLPTVEGSGVAVTVVMGSVDGAASPAWTPSALVAAETRLRSGAAAQLPAERDFEYAVLGVAGDVRVDGRTLERGTLVYLGAGRDAIGLSTADGGTAMLLGGIPFEEQLVMWWNFIGRSHEEIATDRAEWEAADPRFGTVRGYPGDRLSAPVLPHARLRPRGRRR